MGETFTSRIKPSTFVEMFVLTYAIIYNMALLENPALTHFGAMKMGGMNRKFSTFHPVNQTKFGIHI